MHAATPSKDSTGYQGQDIHLEDEYPSDDNYDVYTYDEESEEETSGTEPITKFLGTLALTKGKETH